MRAHRVDDRMVASDVEKSAVRPEPGLRCIHESGAVAPVFEIPTQCGAVEKCSNIIHLDRQGSEGSHWRTVSPTNPNRDKAMQTICTIAQGEPI